ASKVLPRRARAKSNVRPISAPIRSVCSCIARASSTLMPRRRASSSSADPASAGSVGSSSKLRQRRSISSRSGTCSSACSRERLPTAHHEQTTSDQISSVSAGAGSVTSSSAQRDAGAVALRPRAVDATIGLRDRHIVDAGLAALHQPVVLELPVLVAVRPPPATGGVVPLVLEAHGDAVAGERPEILAQHVVELLLPLAHQE